ncbi:glycoside hydrolase superfamily [Dactylonectria macrodidyma]|uniref:beta-glucosidase n=1 Tax=Dactylonectria macrodidyma TaxID=307937 RepID=A0A9P9F5M8_9HYPO|nr:glycoside hydrolase superfamily [Dactylonectria macrodidyma]
MAPAVDIPALLSELTLEEKISLLAGVDWWRTAIIKRDGVFVPHIKFTDGPNGARGESYVSGIKAACFPCGTSLGSTFDSSLLEKIGAAVAKEAETKSANVLLGPTLNVIRSPLGGRNYETYSEDPLVLGTLAAAYVRGCQSEGKIAATPKHFVANDAENQRTTLSVEVDEQTLREIYLKPFQLVVKLSDPWCFMSSYNRVQGTYVADSSRLINGVLRNEWGFKGPVISDWMGTYSSGPGINASVDVEMPGPPKWRTPEVVSNLVQDGSVSEETITNSARRILELAQRLGRFEDPGEPPERAVEDAERDALIKNAGADGIVLLQNKADVLPIPKGASVALIGHHARSVVLGGGGSARVDAVHAITPVEGFEKLGYRTNVALGVPVFGAVPHADPSIVFGSGNKEHSTEPVKLEWFNGSIIGQNLVHEELRPQAEYMIKEQWPEYLDKVEYCTRITFDLVAPSTGDAIFSVISTGQAKCYIDGQLVFERPQETKLRPESFYFFKKQLERRFNHHLESGKRYAIKLESWACDPDILNAAPLFGKMFQGSALRFHEKIDLEGRLEEAKKTAKESDYAVVCVGTTNEIESEGFDRDSLDLTLEQYLLIDAVTASNPKTVVVNFSGAPVSFTQFVNTVPAIVQAWFPGQEAGDSLAAVLTGLANPSGKLPLSWPKKLEDNSSYGNFPATSDDILRYAEGLNVGYRWYDRQHSPEPLFPFGFGLSYTDFTITGASVEGSNSILHPNGHINITAKITNTGSRSGKTVVQFYTASPAGTNIPGHTRPVKELQAFSKVEIVPGESKTVSVQLDKYSVSVYDAKSEHWHAEKGEYRVLVGFSSVDIAQTVSFSVAESFTWTGI